MDQKNPYTNRTRIATTGAEINVTTYDGNGPDLVLIHGIGSSSGDFANVIPELSQFCRPITLDLRGHGASSRPAHGYHYDDYVRDLKEILVALQLDRPIVLGHSLGGIITMFWASRHPNAARALIIEDSPLRSGPSFSSFFEGWLTLNALPQDQVRAWYASENPGWSEKILDQRSFDMVNTARVAIEELRDLSLAGEGLDSAGDLASIAVPMLLMHGDPDAGSMIHPDDLAEMQKRIPQAEIVRIAGAGHNIHRSHADKWVDLVRGFVGNVERVPGI